MTVTILLITGAWHLPEHYESVKIRLQKLGFNVECPRLATNNNAVPPTASLDDDIEQIRNIAIAHMQEGRDIVALMHSYGGVVGSSALAGLESPKPGRVKALIYMCAFVPSEHDSLAGMFGGQLPPFLTNNKKGTIDISNPGWHFYTDLSPVEQEKWTKKLVEHPIAAQFDPPKKNFGSSAWKTIPVTYLFCSGDKGLPVEVQEMMVDKIEQETKRKVRREYCEASHSPFLSMPDRVVEVVEAAINTS